MLAGTRSTASKHCCGIGAAGLDEPAMLLNVVLQVYRNCTERPGIALALRPHSRGLSCGPPEDIPQLLQTLLVILGVIRSEIRAI